MLFRDDILKGIAAGRITVALRRWRRPSVRAGGRLRTAVGELAINAVESISLDDITARDARAAGFASRDDALADVKNQREGTVYRIRFRLAGPDARIALRENSRLTAVDATAIAKQLSRLDARSSVGPWTSKILNLIATNDGLPAGDLAKLARSEKEWLKLNVRKLKELGLTESLQPGYRLSPRGRAWLRRIAER